MEQLNNNPETEQKVVRAITPEEAVELSKEVIPPEVLNTVNRLITEKLQRGKAFILQKEIIAALVEAGMDESEIFRKHWLDFEDMYRDSGWGVTYDKPGWNESYDASFKFEPQKGRRLGSAATQRCVNCSE